MGEWIDGRLPLSTPMYSLQASEFGAALPEIESKPTSQEATRDNKTADAPTTRSKASSSDVKRKPSRGVPSTITSAIAARQHHVEVVKSTEKGLEILSEIMEQLKSDEKEGIVTADLSHIVSESNNVSVVDALDSMISVLDERSKSNIEFVLGVLGVTKVPEPLLERQRNQGQRAVVTALRTKANQKRRQLLKAAKRESQRIAKEAAELATKVAAERAKKLLVIEAVVDEPETKQEANLSELANAAMSLTPTSLLAKNVAPELIDSRSNDSYLVTDKSRVNSNYSAKPFKDGELIEKPGSATGNIVVRELGKHSLRESDVCKESTAPVCLKETEQKKSRFSALSDLAASKRTMPDNPGAEGVMTSAGNTESEVFVSSTPSRCDELDKATIECDREGQVTRRKDNKIDCEDDKNSTKSEARNLDDSMNVPESRSNIVAAEPVYDGNRAETKSEDEVISQKWTARNKSSSPRPSKYSKKSEPDAKGLEFSEASEFPNVNLSLSLRESNKECADGKGKIDISATKEVPKVRKRRARPQRSEKGRFKSKSGGSKARTSMPKVAEYSDDEFESDDEIRPARSSTRNSNQPKPKGPGRKRRVKTENESEAPRSSVNSEEGNGKAECTEEEKKIDLSAYERTPREKRISGRRALLEDPADSTQRSGRLRRESNHLNHDDTETVLWQKNPYMGMCYRAWTAINTVAIAIPFREPVSSRDAPGYYDVIKKPMDLRTIRTRIMDGTLTTPVEFQRDLNQIVKNAMTYNAKDSDIYELATLFREKMKSEVDPIVEAWRTKESGKTSDLSERVAEVQRLANAGSRVSARYPSRRARFAPPTERSSSPSPQPKRSRTRVKRRTGAERNEVVETEDERSVSKRGGTGGGRGRGRSRKSKVNERTGAKEKDKTKPNSKRKNATGGVDDEPSLKRRRRLQD